MRKLWRAYKQWAARRLVMRVLRYLTEPEQERYYEILPLEVQLAMLKNTLRGTVGQLTTGKWFSSEVSEFVKDAVEDVAFWATYHAHAFDGCDNLAVKLRSKLAKGFHPFLPRED